MKIEIEIDGDKIEDIVRKDLISSIDYLLKNDWGYCHDYEKTFDKIMSMVETLDFYCTKKQMADFYFEYLARIIQLSRKFSEDD